MKNILNAFSYVFHPLFISVYAVLLFFLFGEGYFDYPEIYLILIQIIIITILIPLTFYYLLLSTGKADSIMLSKINQRKIPLLIHALLLFVLIKKSITITLIPELHFFFLGGLISALLALGFVYAGIKASLHMIGITALTCFAVGISLHYQTRMIFVVISLFFCTGFVATSRLEMQAHTQTELLWGAAIGIIPQIVLLYYWL